MMGGPYGIFMGIYDDRMLDDFNFKVLLEVPERGYLAENLKQDLKYCAVKKDLPWFDASIEEVLSILGHVLATELQGRKARYYHGLELGN